MSDVRLQQCPEVGSVIVCVLDNMPLTLLITFRVWETSLRFELWSWRSSR